MENIKKKIEELKEKFLETKNLLGVEEKMKREKALQGEMSVCGFWTDAEKAVKISQEAGELSNEIREWNDLEGNIDILLEKDASEEEYLELEKSFSKLEFISLFSEDYDKSNVILAIHAGTGGVDAQDWAEMLERMFLRFCEQKKWKVEIMDKNYGNEAGIKSVVMRVSGAWAYGHLKSENGVHRLLRISPFDGEGLRHTSFALVEIVPELEESGEIVINDDDIKIDVFKSSGPGGQSVNTTDSAVRITHIPSGIVVSCQNQRSQHQNKDNALKILRTKLYKLALEEKEAEERKLKGEIQKAEWGKQIRSYFMYGNQLVKDHRSNYETTNVESVLDGGLDDFVEHYLKWLKNN